MLSDDSINMLSLPTLLSITLALLYEVVWICLHLQRYLQNPQRYCDFHRDISETKRYVKIVDLSTYCGFVYRVTVGKHSRYLTRGGLTPAIMNVQYVIHAVCYACLIFSVFFMENIILYYI